MNSELLAGCDSPSTQTDKAQWLQERFRFERQLLLSDNAHQLDRPDWWLAMDAVEHLAEILRNGAATPEIQTMLAAYLAELINSDDSKTALALLGCKNNGGRPDKKLEELRAIDAYQVQRGRRIGRDGFRSRMASLFPK